MFAFRMVFMMFVCVCVYGPHRQVGESSCKRIQRHLRLDIWVVETFTNEICIKRKR